MKFFLHAICSGLMVFSLAGAALAQDGQGPGPSRRGGAGGGPLSEIAPEKREQVRDVLQKFRQKQQALRTQMMSELKGILTPEEFQRVSQRMSQRMGPRGQRGPGQGGPNSNASPKNLQNTKYEDDDV